ncbi:MAG: LysR family transcriptional regulator [Paraglaciecola sp.]|uniref:LysR family transcriptional regulator n=2 Tax=Paraglaciecola sp. TaxID=1920173 RepID=UPI003266C384
MDRFKEMQVFVRVAERSSFAWAAADLLLPRSTVTNVIKRMEARLNARLLERTTRKVRLTLDGEAYYKKCLRLLTDLDDMESSLSGATPKGVLRINLQGTLASHFVMPNIKKFIVQYPEINLQIGEDDRLVDLVTEGIDCVLRAGELKDSSLIAKKLADLTQLTVASPDYLKEHGKPLSLDDLQSHVAVGYSLDTASKPTTLDFKVDNTYIDVNLPSITHVAGADLYTNACLAGLGLIQVPKYRILKELALGELIPVLPQYTPPPMPVSALYPQNRHLSPRIRAFVNWLQEIFNQLKSMPEIS